MCFLQGAEMFENFDEKYSTITKFFETLTSNENCAVPNSIILHGPDVIGQYCFAMLLARGANCHGDKTTTCECQNCRWIKANEHPEIMTVTKINSKSEGDETKTVISVKQTEQIKDKLMVASDYHRFFIFCDAEIRDFTQEENDSLKIFENVKQNFPKSEKGNWVPMGLTRTCFTDIVANSLLKSIEEPPSKVTFIFLTENIENIISTIVSRSQAFYVPGSSKKNYNYDFLKEPLTNYPNIDGKKAIMLSDFLMKYSKENDKPMSVILYAIQQYLTDIIKNNSSNLVLKERVFSDTEKIQNVINMLKSGIKDNIAADETGYILTQDRTLR